MSFLNDVLQIFLKYSPQLLQGIGNTMLIALTGTLAGLAIGLLTGVVRTAPLPVHGFVRFLRRLLNGLIACYVEIFRGTPMMVQAMVIYWLRLCDRRQHTAAAPLRHPDRVDQHRRIHGRDRPRRHHLHRPRPV